MEGYFFVADLLGFKKIIHNSSDQQLSERIDSWVKLVNGAADTAGIDKFQLVSDTIFAYGDLKRLVAFGKQLLNNGVNQSLPVRGAISWGTFEWGKLTYGKAVARAYELESVQNWIGIVCDHSVPVPRLEPLWGKDSLVCYPPPLRKGLIRLHPVISWDVPSYTDMSQILCGGGLTAEGEQLTWEWGDKLNNTAVFGLYKEWMSKQREPRYNKCGMPLEIIHNWIMADESNKTT